MTRSGTTGADGKLILTLAKAPTGCYSTTVTSVTAPGWDSATPLNNFCG